MSEVPLTPDMFGEQPSNRREREVPDSNEDLLALYRKVALATAAMERITKDKTADTGKYTYTYADLSDVLETVQAALTVQGLTLMQPIIVDREYICMTTLLIDQVTGQSINFPGPAARIANDPQANGSSISYLRRYALTTLFALKVADDDGAMAHRAATNPTGRTKAEEEVRKMIGEMTDDHRRLFVHEFREEFGSGLSDLPESKHGDALTFAKRWDPDAALLRATGEAHDATPEDVYEGATS